ncbi:hypothetical protein CRG98_002302 [Punica granatum]|uniref:PGG domain-containing protein n=1 Tax=Punica granatum TaxID=22663 RepID=A0A2I0L9I4_PUNGR|nr:hypothetical protein CRG98_002302 [Punica granatum]
MWYLTLKTTDDPPGRPFTGPKAGSLIQGLVWSGSYVIPEEVELDQTPPRLFSNDVEDPLVNTRISPTSTTYWTRVRQWSIQTAWKAQDYFAFGAIKCIQDEKYKHKCTQRLVEITCQVIANEEDFLRDLPQRLILGFTSLFLAVATMMVAFGATLYMVLNERFHWILFPIIALTAIPVALFAKSQLPLLIFMVQSTHGARIFHHQKIWQSD